MKNDWTRTAQNITYIRTYWPGPNPWVQIRAQRAVGFSTRRNLLPEWRARPLASPALLWAWQDRCGQKNTSRVPQAGYNFFNCSTVIKCIRCSMQSICAKQRYSVAFSSNHYLVSTPRGKYSSQFVTRDWNRVLVVSEGQGWHENKQTLFC